MGNDVVLIGKERVGNAIEKNGLTVSDLENRVTHIPAENIHYSRTPDAIKGHDVILLCVKCPHTRQAAKEIAANADPGAVIFSFQNGVGNTATLKEELKGHDIVAAMVGFNAVSLEDNRVHRATDAGIVLGKNVASHELARLLRNAHIPTSISENIEDVLWGKLCLNLNNALNVLSDMPLKQQLEDRSYRRVLARCIDEALAVMSAKDIKPAQIGKLKPRMIPRLLRLPDPVFRVVARNMMKIDDEARSSMWEDLQMNREPEIDYLNGAIVRAGEEVHVATPANSVIVELVNKAFLEGKSPAISGEELLEKTTFLPA